MINREELENDFTKALEGTIKAAKNAGYNPSHFSQMLAEFGGVETAKRLLASSKAQEGLNKLWELNLLPESMEAIVIQEKYQPIFTEEERAEARKRLKDRGFEG